MGVLGKERKREFAILVIWTLVLWGLLLAPISGEGIVSDLGFKHWDKIAHFCLFGVTGFVGAFAVSFFGFVVLRSCILFGIIFGLFLAVCTVSHQLPNCVAL